MIFAGRKLAEVDGDEDDQSLKCFDCLLISGSDLMQLHL